MLFGEPLMKIVNAGYHYTHPSTFSISRPNGSGDYILLILRTEAYFIIDGEKELTPPNSAIFFKIGTPQLYGATGEKFANDWLHIEMNDAEEKDIEALGVPFDTVMSFDSVAPFSEIIKSIFCERYSQNRYKEDSMKLYFDLMIRKIAEKLYDPHPQKENAFYGTLCNLQNAIRLKPQKAWTIEEICQEINISRSYLQHLYKSFFGVSITTDIQYSRIEYAKHLLSSTNLTVYNVSASCGYPSDVHFMRVFKKATGITPSQFRTEFGILQKEIDAGKNRNPFTKKQ